MKTFAVTTIDKVSEILAISHAIDKPLLIEGPSGIGKSECVEYAALHDLGIGYKCLDLSLLDVGDLTGLPRIENGLTVFAPPITLPQSGRGILHIEELNRAEKFIIQPTLQLLTARRLNEYVLPDDWSIVATINPADSLGYDTGILDTAMMDRFMHVHVTPDREVWLDWAQASGIHGLVIDFVKAKKNALDEVTPRSWAAVSDLFHLAETDRLPSLDAFNTCVESLVPKTWLAGLLSKLTTQRVIRSPIDANRILSKYATDKQLRARLKKLRESGRTDALAEITKRIVTTMEKVDIRELAKAKKFSLASLERVVEDLPGDLGEQVQIAFGSNSTAISQLKYDARTVLKSYESDLAEIVKEWARQPMLRHRVWALATGVTRYLDNHGRIGRVRRDTMARRNLASFASKLDGSYAHAFEKTLKKHNLNNHAAAH